MSSMQELQGNEIKRKVYHNRPEVSHQELQRDDVGTWRNNDDEPEHEYKISLSRHFHLPLIPIIQVTDSARPTIASPSQVIQSTKIILDFMLDTSIV